MSGEEKERVRTTERQEKKSPTARLQHRPHPTPPGHPRGSTNFQNTSMPYFFPGPLVPFGRKLRRRLYPPCLARPLAPSPSLAHLRSFFRSRSSRKIRAPRWEEGVLSVIVATFPATTSTRKGPHVAFHTSTRPSVRPSRGHRRREERRRATPNSQPTGRVNRVNIVPREWASLATLAIPRPDNCFAASRAREVNDTHRRRGLSKHSLEYHFVAPRVRLQFGSLPASVLLLLLALPLRGRPLCWPTRLGL